MGLVGGASGDPPGVAVQRVAEEPNPLMPSRGKLFDILRKHRVEALHPQGDPEQALLVLWSSRLVDNLMTWARAKPWWKKWPNPLKFPIETTVAIVILAFLANIFWFSARAIQAGYVPLAQHQHLERELSSLSKQVDRLLHQVDRLFQPIPDSPERRKWVKPLWQR